MAKEHLSTDATVVEISVGKGILKNTQELFLGKYWVWLCSVNRTRLGFWSSARVIYIISDVCIYPNCMVKRDSVMAVLHQY